MAKTIYESLRQFGQDEGVKTALQTAEAWHLTLEEMAEATSGSEYQAIAALDREVSRAIYTLVEIKKRKRLAARAKELGNK